MLGDDPQLPADSVDAVLLLKDAVLLLKTYHEVARPVELLKNLRKSLRSGAKIGIIDKDGNGADPGIGKEVIVHEAAQAGYTLLESNDFVKSDGVDYFLTFTVLRKSLSTISPARCGANCD